ncbi:MAG: hypothetical protein H7839_20235 [Magnetococcus sp. YQC-5]
MNNEYTRLHDGPMASRVMTHATSGMARLDHPRNATGSNPDAVEVSPERPLTPLTLDTVLTVDNLQRLLKIVSFS